MKHSATGREKAKALGALLLTTCLGLAVAVARLAPYSKVKFSDIAYADAWNEGLRHDRIMEQVLAMPGIAEKWESEEVERRALELVARV